MKKEQICPACGQKGLSSQPVYAGIVPPDGAMYKTSFEGLECPCCGSYFYYPDTVRFIDVPADMHIWVGNSLVSLMSENGVRPVREQHHSFVH
jgi:hypothetical protein